MMKKALSVVTLLAAGASQAAGFALDTHSARATGMASAVTATLDDSGAIAYNAANILGVKKLDITVGDLAILPRVKFTPTEGQEQDQKVAVSPPPHAFAVYRFHEKAALGLGVFVPFGARSLWKEDFVGRTRGQESELAIYYINPTFAYQLHERLRVGAGVDVARGTVIIRRALNFVESEGKVELGGGGWGVGFNVGLQAELFPKRLHFGAHYRSKVSMDFEGQADFQNVPVEFESRLQDQGVQSSVSMPGFLTLGLAATPLERLTVAFDAYWVHWSTFDEFVIEFDDPALTNPLPKEWKNHWNFHLGAEYAVTEAFSARLGLAYDPSPSPAETLTPDLPDSDRYKVTAGLGYAFQPLRVDVAYQLALLGNKESTAPGISGTYSGVGHVFGATIGYSLP